MVNLGESPVKGIYLGDKPLMDIPFRLSGTNAELVSVLDKYYSLADTSFQIGVTAPTSSLTVLPSVSNYYNDATGSPNYEYGDKDIVVLQYCNADIEHDATADNVSKMLKGSNVLVTYFSKRKTSETGAKSARHSLNSNVQGLIKNYNTSGILTRSGSASYGIYGTPQSPSMSSSTSDAAHVKISSPPIYARATNAYEKEANMKKITDFTVHWHVEVYAVDPFSTVDGAVNDVHDEFLTD